jgi:hypothetical protein
MLAYSRGVPNSLWSALARETGASAVEFARWTMRKRQSAGAYRRALRRHQRAVRKWRTVYVSGLGGGGVAVGVLFSSGDVVVALVAALAGGGMSALARVRSGRLTPPEPADYPTVTVAFDSRGGRALRRLDHASRRMRDACLAVAALDRSTGRELEQATGLAERSLRLTAQQLGTIEGLDGAADAAAKLTAQLEAGVAAYEQTLAAAAELLSAPSVDPPVGALLRDAQEALAARTYGQTVAAERLSRLDRLA